MSLIKLLKGPKVHKRTVGLVQTFPFTGRNRGPAGVIHVFVVTPLVREGLGCLTPGPLLGPLCHICCLFSSDEGWCETISHAMNFHNTFRSLVCHECPPGM